MKQGTEAARAVGERILSLIDSTFESDSEFEREMNIPAKTVSNWRRGLSTSYMRRLPDIAERFGVSVGALLDAPLSRDSSELSDDELRLLQSYRRTGKLSAARRAALCETLERVIELYTSDADDHTTRRNAKRKDKQ